MRFERGDINNLPFDDSSFDGIISYYSIVDTSKIYVDRIFSEFGRVLKPASYLLVAVKEGTTEGYIDDLLGEKFEIYLTLFTEEEVANYFEKSGFIMQFIEKRNPYDFEISNERIFAIGKKV
jgi:ubiquinone/menaquinone biosynthesis C-methylase UbiE